MKNNLIFHWMYIVLVCSVVRADQHPTQSKYKVGVSSPLTGDVSEYGQAVRQGIQLAIDQGLVEKDRIEFIYEDNGYDAAKALTVFKKLKDIDHVNLIYNWGEPPLYAIAPIAEQTKTPVLAMSLDPAPSAKSEYIIRTINSSDYFAKSLIKYFQDKNFKTIGIIQAEDPFLNSMVEGLKKNAVDGQKIEVFAKVKPDLLDFKSFIPRIKTKNYDVFGVYLFTGQGSTFFRQAKSQGFSKPTFGTDFMESRKEIAQAKGSMEGSVYPNVIISPEFSIAYVKKFQNDSQIAYAYNAYVVAKIINSVLTSDPKLLDPLEILTKLKNPREDLGFKFKHPKEEGAFYEFQIGIKKVSKDYVENIQ